MSMACNMASAHDIAVANSNGKTIYYNYNSDGSSVSVTYQGTSYSSYSNEYSGEIVIPETVTYSGQTYGVTSIGSYAFYGCNALTSVTIPNSVTSIGAYAFYRCWDLTSVTIPNSVTSIGSYAFYNCSGLTSVTIPNSVTSIGSSAFYNTRIKSLTLGSGLQSIASDAFDYSSLTNGVAIDAKPIKVIWLANTPPSGYDEVGGTINYVPNDSYSGLSNRKIYPFLSSMFEVDGIKYVPVSPSERTCDAIDCVYNESAENTKIGNTATYKNITMTVKNVGNSICYGNTYIKTLEYNFDGPIGDYAFFGCRGLTSVTIPNSVTSISSWAFCDCRGLTSVTIPNSVTSIGNGAFYGCSGLTSVNIPNSVTSIGGGAFFGCSGLTSVRFENSKDNTPVTLGSNTVFSYCPLDEVYIGRKLSYTTTSSAGYSPFYRNTTLRSVKFTDKETEISDYEFYGCTNLTDVSMGDGVKSIGAYAFSGCSSLEQFTCGRQLESIGKEAFSDCTSMTKFRTRAAVPPTCGAQALDDINKWECTLYVPTESIDDYQAADQWKNFFFIENFRVEGDCNGDDAVTMADANAVVNYFLAKGTDGFVEGDFDEEAADVNGDGEITMADANQIVNMFLSGGQ